jgi:hypothetical protein
MTNHLFQKIRDAVEGRQSRLFLETPAGFALTYAEIITRDATRRRSRYNEDYYTLIYRREK